MPELENFLAGLNTNADYYVHTPDHNYFMNTAAKDFLIPKIWPNGRNKELYTFFAGKRDMKEDIIESVIPLSVSDRGVLLEKPTVFDTFLQIDKNQDKRSILDSYFLPIQQPHLEGWLIQQNRYLDKLNDRQKAAINAYTFHGDKFINGFLRNTLGEDLSGLLEACIKSQDIPFKWAIYDNYEILKNTHHLFLPPKDSILKGTKIDDAVILSILLQETNYRWFSLKKNIAFLIVGLIADLTKVIFNAPRTRLPLVVYRGVKSEFTSSLQYKSTDYWSTSLDPYAAVKFSDMDIGKRLQGVVYEITINSGIPCLFLERFTHFKSSEQEVLLPPGISYQFSKKMYIKMRVEKNPYVQSSFEEYVDRAMSTAVKYRILTIAGKATDFDPHALTLKDVVHQWEQEKQKLAARAKMFLHKYGGPRLSREEAGLPILKQTRAPFTRVGKTRKSRGSRERTLSRQKRRAAKVGSRESRDDVDFSEQAEED